jgi:hypothetical protein
MISLFFHDIKGTEAPALVRRWPSPLGGPEGSRFAARSSDSRQLERHAGDATLQAGRARGGNSRAAGTRLATS